MAPKASKKSDSSEDGSLDTFLSKIQPNKFSTEQQATYFGIAATMCLIPAWLYSSVYNYSPLTLEYGVIYLLVTLGSAGMLTLAYKNVQQSTAGFLKSSSRRSGFYKSATGANDAASTESSLYLESLSWSLLLNNAIFLSLFLFLSFYALKNVDPGIYAYAVSALLGAAAAWQMSETR